MNPFEIPNLFDMQRALFIQPHPDDNDIGAGATIAKLTASGIEVHYLTVSDGSSGSDNPKLTPKEIMEMRKLEQIKAGRMLGVQHFFWLDYPDGHLFDSEHLRAKIMEVIRNVNPDIVFTCDPWLPYEAHVDHIVTGKVATFVALMAGNPHYYQEQLQQTKPSNIKAIAYYATHRPNTMINVDDYWEDKFKAIQAHASQFSAEYFKWMKSYFTQRALEQAKQANEGCQLVESFKVLTPMMLHYNVDAEDM